MLLGEGSPRRTVVISGAPTASDGKGSDTCSFCCCCVVSVMTPPKPLGSTGQCNDRADMLFH